MKPLAPFVKFDQSLIGKMPIYIFPLPNGPRCYATCDGISVTMHLQMLPKDADIQGFLPDIEAALLELYTAMFNEPNPKYTTNGKQTTFPELTFDMILYDANTDEKNDGSSKVLAKHLNDFWDLGAPAPTGSVTALILCPILTSELESGGTRTDIWWQRAWLCRGLARIGMINPYAKPKPILRHLTIAPRNWDSPTGGVGTNQPDMSWAMIYNCFNRAFKGALIVDVWQGYKVRGDAFRVLLEEDVEI